MKRGDKDETAVLRELVAALDNAEAAPLREERPSVDRHSFSGGIEQFNAVTDAMRGAPDLVELGRDGQGEDRFTTRDMIETEQRLHRAAEMMAERERHEVNDRNREAALARAEQRGLVLSGEQTDALAHV